MKIPKTHFERFKKEFNRWVTIFGLTQYRIEFRFKKDEGNHASICIEEGTAKIALITLANEIPDGSEHISPEANAKHEAIHLLTSRLRCLGGSRYIGCDELNEEDEALVRRLEKVL